MTVDRNKINSFALMYGTPITKQDAIKAADVLWNQSGEYLLNKYSIVHIVNGVQVDNPAYNAEYDARYDAYQTIMRFIEATNTTNKKVKVVYEYKLKRADGKYLNKSSWDEKGKTYKNKSALMSALGQYIGDCISHDKREPHYPKERDQYGQIPLDVYEAYRERQKAWHEWTKDRNNRAVYIPVDWIVIAIAVNTAQEPKEIEAQLWYKSLKKPEDV